MRGKVPYLILSRTCAETGNARDAPNRTSFLVIFIRIRWLNFAPVLLHVEET